MTGSLICAYNPGQEIHSLAAKRLANYSNAFLQNVLQRLISTNDVSLLF